MKDYLNQSKAIASRKPLIFNNLDYYKKRLKVAQNYLSAKDKVLSKIIKEIGDCRLKPHKKYFETLVDAIISQQLSVKVAETIFNRFKKLFINSSERINRFPEPNEIISMQNEKIRACGLSNSKVMYVKDLALKVQDGLIKIKLLKKLQDDEIINELIQVKGIGVWTAHMFLIFCLGRVNVLPTGDLGLKRAVMLNYKLKKFPDELKIKKLSKQLHWFPYNSIATWYLWQSLHKNEN
jgi:DNA-3-methyladenine glycosylase II